jgi:hypothetical protein
VVGEVLGWDPEGNSMSECIYNFRVCSHLLVVQRPGAGPLTPSRSSRSSLWRGTIVTSSISQMKAISGGVRPDGWGNAMLSRRITVCTITNVHLPMG